MRTMSSVLHSQHGAVAPFVAIMLVLLVGIVSLVVDIGHAVNVKNQLQQAVDAAALAGAGQLNTLSDAADRAINAAQSTIIENDVLVRDVDLATESVVVTLGRWDAENLGAPFADRWSPETTPYNAVHVQAEVEVDYFFNLSQRGTTIPVDALAVQDRTELTLPLAIVSCIPPTGPQGGEFNVCGIKTYSFSSNENTAGWTALTLGGNGGASQQEIADLFDGNGAEQFNRIAELLNLTAVAQPPPPWSQSYTGCEGNYDENIICGLGGNFNNYIPSGSSDPLTRYDELPRYITESDNELRAFADILSQDGVLFRQNLDDADPSNDESHAQFQARLHDLYFRINDSGINPFGDDRFSKIGTEEQLIRFVNDKFDFDKDGITNEKVFIPNYNRAIDYAGYPPVSATTGSMTTVMGKLIDLITPPFKQKKAIQFTGSQTDENPPFDDASSGGIGETLLFTVPVIFAGACDGFDPSSHDTNNAQVQEDNELHYVGLANFLVTRIWKGGDCYECSDPVVLTSAANSHGCTPTDHVPSLLNGDSYACPVKLPGGSIAFEGLIRPPGYGGGPTGVRVVTYLVE